jgi:hypothetical protein
MDLWKMRIGVFMVVGFLGVTGFPLIVGAGGQCAVGKSRCIAENAASRIDDRAREEARKEIESARADDPDLQQRIAPINSNPAGQSYGRWATEWEQWALGVPAAVSPLTDPTGQHCAQRQVDRVWFLAGSTIGPVERRCTVPAGKSFFFPLINTAYFAFLNDSPETRTEEFVRAAGSCTVPVQIRAWIDRVPVPNPTEFFTGRSGSRSPFFNVQLPPGGNIFGLDETVIPELLLSPSTEQGYYLFVRPLSPGRHMIRWIASGCTKDALGNVFSQDITYHLTVVP